MKESNHLKLRAGRMGLLNGGYISKKINFVQK